MNNSTIYKFGFLLLVFVMIISSCVKTPATDETEDQATDVSVVTPEPVKLKVGISPYLSNTVFMIAEEEGYFDEQGLDVEFILLPNTNEIIPLLLSGEFDIAAPGLSAAFFNAVARGGDLKVLMPLTDFAIQDCSSIAYLARTADVEAGIYIDKLEWKNANLVVSTNGLTSIPGYILGRTVDSVGLTVDDLQVGAVDLPAQEEALRTGQLDIVYAIEPWITRMTAAGDISVLEPAEQYAPDLTASIIVGNANIIDNPDIAQRFSVAYLKAVRQYMEGKTDQNVEIAAELTGLTPELVKQICWSHSSPNGVINMDSLMDYQNWLMSRGLLDEVVAPEQFFDGSFAEYAVGVLGAVEP